MPAIDPRRLDHQIEAAVAQLHKPADMVKAFRDILSFYSDRTRRPSNVLQSSDSVPAFGTPKPVIRQARRKLQAVIREADLDAEPLIEALWSGGERELRLIAVSLLAELEWSRAVEWAQKLVQANKDPQVIDALATSGLSGWREAAEAELTALIEEWLESKDGQLQRLSLLLLDQHIESASSQYLPTYYSLLADAAGKLDRRAQPTLRKVLRRLAKSNPAETAQFLLDQGRGNGWRRPYRQLVENLIDSFPQAQQREIRSTLKTL